jgi:hypothetical protein
MKEQLWLEQAEERLRRAAARGDFAAAEIAAVEYVRAVELAAAGLPRTAAAACIRQAMAALELARRQLCVARARLARKLRAVECRMRFQPASIATTTWRIEA